MVEDVKTYVVYGKEYFFSMNTLTTIEKQNVYNIASSLNEALEIKESLEDMLANSVSSMNSKREMLTAFDLDVIELEGNLSLEEAKEQALSMAGNRSMKR